MNKEEFKKSLSELGIIIDKNIEDKFEIYANYLLEYNKKVNLTAIRNKEEVYLKHFYDSLLFSKIYSLTDEKVLDIGSGAGFPGIPLLICFPNIKLTVLDSNGKKTRFLEELKTILNLEYTVVNDRVEHFTLSNRKYFDIVTSRAVTAMPVLAELSLPLVKIGGHFIPLKGHLDETLENGVDAILILGGKIIKTQNCTLPKENSVRTIIDIQKTCQTDEIYPRQYDKIVKKPLQKKS